MRTPPWPRRSPTLNNGGKTPDAVVAAKARVNTLPMMTAALVVAATGIAATGIAASLMVGRAVADECPRAAPVEVATADTMVIVATEADTVDKPRDTTRAADARGKVR